MIMILAKRRYAQLIALSLMINTLPVMADGILKPTKLPSAYVATLSLGPTWGSGGDSQTFFLTEAIEKSYIANNSSHALFDGEFFLGLYKNLSSSIQGQLGAALAATSNAKLSGIIWDDAMPQFDNYSYNYKVNHTHVAIKGKLLADKGFPVIPWVSASLGVGFNRAHQFKSIPRIFEALPNAPFTSHTTSAFTYTLGAGVQKNLSEHWQVGIGYEFADFGKSHLGPARGQTLNSGLSLNHLYTNGVLLNLTYFA
jgi:opacity protein-like surface antigen